ncbi:MAG: ABC transporter permease [Chloroflexi bacterium]|nr:ABC transporter permease [Chloroflexota bacterium]
MTRSPIQRAPPVTLLAAGLLGVLLLAAVLAPRLAPHDPRHAVPEDQLQSPSAAHPFGTDYLGRDVFSRVLFGGRRTLGMALLAAGVTLLPGLAVGVVAGAGKHAAGPGPWLDAGLMVVMDALLAFPHLLLALVMVALLGSGTTQIALAVGVAGLPAYARVTRAAVIEGLARPHLIGARAIGAGWGGVVWRHVLPGIAPTLLAFAGVTLSWAILNSAALTFLGYGGDISAPDWGVMLADGRAVYRVAPWVVIAPGAALSLTVLAINLLLNGSRR